MDVKQLLKQAVDAKIAGDRAAFQASMKQVMAAKVSGMVAEMSDQFPKEQDDDEQEGDYEVRLEEYDYNGTLVDALLGVNIGHYQAATQGNYSSRASDPSEYHGDPEEIEWHVVTATLISEDGSEQRLSGEEAAALTFSDRETDRITDELLDQLQEASKDDDSWDNGRYD